MKIGSQKLLTALALIALTFSNFSFAGSNAFHCFAYCTIPGALPVVGTFALCPLEHMSQGTSPVIECTEWVASDYPENVAPGQIYDLGFKESPEQCLAPCSENEGHGSWCQGYAVKEPGMPPEGTPRFFNNAHYEKCQAVNHKED